MPASASEGVCDGGYSVYNPEMLYSHSPGDHPVFQSRPMRRARKVHPEVSRPTVKAHRDMLFARVMGAELSRHFRLILERRPEKVDDSE